MCGIKSGRDMILINIITVVFVLGECARTYKHARTHAPMDTVESRRPTHPRLPHTDDQTET